MKIFFSFLALMALCGMTSQEKVIRVIDGDTIVTNKTGKIRILGIDTFDTNQKMVKKQQQRTNFSKKTIKKLSLLGKQFAENELLGKNIVLKTDHIEKDFFGRNLRYVFVNNIDYSEKIIKTGLANCYCGDKKIKNYKKYNEISKFPCK